MSGLTILEINKLIWQVFPELTSDEKAWVIRNYYNVVWWIASYGQLETQLGTKGVGVDYFLGIGALGKNNLLPNFAGADKQVKTFIKKLHQYFPDTLPEPTDKNAVLEFQRNFYKSTVEVNGKEISGEQAYNEYANRVTNVATYMKSRIDKENINQQQIFNWLNLNELTNTLTEIGKEQKKEQQQQQTQANTTQSIGDFFKNLWNYLNPLWWIQQGFEKKKDELKAGLISVGVSIILLIVAIVIIISFVKGGS